MVIWVIKIFFCIVLLCIPDFPGGSDSKASAYNAGSLGSILGSGRSPGEGNGNPLQYSFFFFFSTPVFLPGKSHGQKSLVDYSPRGRKESDTTERLSFFLCILATSS